LSRPARKPGRVASIGTTVLRSPVPAEERLPGAPAAERFSDRAHAPSLFFVGARHSGRRKPPAGAGVKNTDGARRKGYDAGKKVFGIKRHIFGDTQGLPHAIALTTAKVTDRQGALEASGPTREPLSEATSIRVEGGYGGQPFAESRTALARGLCTRRHPQRLDYV
jgi:hypothetical protein